MSAREDTDVTEPVRRDRVGLRPLWEANGVSMLGDQMTAVGALVHPRNHRECCPGVDGDGTGLRWRARGISGPAHG